MSDLESLVDQMRLSDQRWQQLFAFQTIQPKREVIDEAIKLSQQLKEVLKGEPNVKEVTKNEELIDLYFNRFLVSDQTSGGEENNNRFYLNGKEKCKQLSEQLFETMADIVSNNSDITDDTFDLQSTSDLLVRAAQELKTKTLKSMAENDIKIFESKQMANKLGIKWTQSHDNTN